MKIARLVGLMLVAVFAMSFAGASTALAEPEFNPTSGNLSGASGAGTLEADNGVDKVTCTSDKSTGTITGATTVGNVVVHFLGCKSTGPKGSNCEANSEGQTGGLILTHTLDGVLGLILPKGSTTGVGLLLLPSSGTSFVTLAGNGCTAETEVTGTVAGEASPIAKKQTLGTLKFATSGSAKAAIKEFDRSGGTSVTAKLTAFTTEASEETIESVTFTSGATEIT